MFSACKVGDKPVVFNLENREGVLILVGDISLVRRGGGNAIYYSLAEVYPTDNEASLHGISFKKVYLGSVEGVQEHGQTLTFRGREPDADPFDDITVAFSLSEGKLKKIEMESNDGFENADNFFNRKK